MNNLSNLPPFYIGQKVVAIKNHSQGVFKKGDTFTVLGVSKHCCKWCIEIGIQGMGKWECSVCNVEHPHIKEWFMHADMFSPIQEQSYPLMTFSKIVEKEKEQILINN